PHSMDVEKYEGKLAQLEIVDDMEGPWGHIGVDYIVLADVPAGVEEFEELPGYGSMALSLLDGEGEVSLELPVEGGVEADWFTGLRLVREVDPGAEVSSDFGRHPVSGFAKSFALAPGELKQIDFVVGWWFPYFRPLRGGFDSFEGINNLNRH